MTMPDRPRYCCDDCLSMRTPPEGMTLPREDLIPDSLRQLHTRTKSELIGLLHDAIHDWQKLNQIHNDRAFNNSWCGEYERNQETYNKRFRVFMLHARDTRLLGSYDESQPLWGPDRSGL